MLTRSVSVFVKIGDSNSRKPCKACREQWYVALAAAAAIIFAIELFWRHQGYAPTVIDSTELWCRQRDKVAKLNTDGVVLVGHSRLRQGFVKEEFDKLLPESDVVQLAVFNSSPISTLRDIAENTEFNGTVVCSILSHCLLPEAWEPTRSDPYRSPVVEYYHREWNFFRFLDNVVATKLQSSLTVLQPELSLHQVAPDIARGEWPVQWIWDDENRMQRVRYDLADLADCNAYRIREIDSIMEERTNIDGYRNWPQFDKLARIEEWVKSIRERGGRVIFVRAVTSGQYGETIDRYFPRDRFWDEFARFTSAETMHYRDFPELAKLECAEGSHLYWDDARIFTRTIAATILSPDHSNVVVSRN